MSGNADRPRARAIIEICAWCVLTPLTITLGRTDRDRVGDRYAGFEPTIMYVGLGSIHSSAVPASERMCSMAPSTSSRLRNG